jgi:hypothetical protein
MLHNCQSTVKSEGPRPPTESAGFLLRAQTEELVHPQVKGPQVNYELALPGIKSAFLLGPAAPNLTIRTEDTIRIEDAPGR